MLFIFFAFSELKLLIFVVLNFVKKFIELLRRGTAEARDSAIDCLRTVLAPCALDAYPVLTDSLFYALFFFFLCYCYDISTTKTSFT